MSFRRYLTGPVWLWLGCAAIHAQTPYASSETLILDGKATPLGVFQASDPHLFNLGGQWATLFTSVGWMTGCSGNPVASMESALAALPPGNGLGSGPYAWQVIPDGRGGFANLIAAGPSGSWDHDGIESPEMAVGYDPNQHKNVARIYYTGWRRVWSAGANTCQPESYRDMEVGMAEWDAGTSRWVKHPTPALSAVNPWEQMHYEQPDGTLVPYSMIGDQSVIYVPAAPDRPAAWHSYYQAVTDVPTVRVITVHAESSDGVSWPAGNRSVLQTHPPSPSALLTGGPYSVSVSVIGGKFFLVGWIPHADPAKQGLWIVSSTTPDGSAPGDFTDWRPLVFDDSGVWWHSGDKASLASHQVGLNGPVLVQENDQLWLFYSGVRQDSDGYWSSIGRALVDPAVLQ